MSVTVVRTEHGWLAVALSNVTDDIRARPIEDRPSLTGDRAAGVRGSDLFRSTVEATP
jgi:hypothetical protein